MIKINKKYAHTSVKCTAVFKKEQACPILNKASAPREGEEKNTLASFFSAKASQTSSFFTHKSIKGLIGHPVNAKTLLLLNNKSVAYSFKKINNMQSLITKTEYLIKSFFLSMYSLTSKPVYLIKHNKIIIRLFVFLAPKADKYLDTSLILKGGKFIGTSPTVFNNGKVGFASYNKGKNFFSFFIKKFLNFKKMRPNGIEIFKTQIQPLTNVTTTKTHFAAQHRAVATSAQQEADQTNKKSYLYLNEDFPYISYGSTFKFKLEKLSEILKKIFKKEVEFEIIKAQLPFQDSNILAQILGYNANNYKFRQMLKILIPRATIKNPSKELSYIPTNRPHKQALINSNSCVDIAKSLNFKVKDLNLLFSQPSSYLPSFFFSKYMSSCYAPVELASYSVLPFKKEATHSCYAPVGLESCDRAFITDTGKLSPITPSNLLKKTTVKTSYLSGMNIKLAGRLMTQSIRPRFTVQSKQEGSLARVKVHYTEKSRFTGKNKRGAFSFTVTIGHVLR